MTSKEATAEAAWIAYRDQYQRERPWCDRRRAGRQLRRREFVAGFIAGLQTRSAGGES